MMELGKGVPKFGFGLMRLPKIDDKIDLEQVKEMVDLYMDAGFCYFDTAWAYTGSEEAIGEALVKRYPRESYMLATKAAVWINPTTEAEAKRQLEVSLERTGAGYFDYYLLHNVGEARRKYFDDFGMWDWIQEKKKEGVIKHAGLSVHCPASELDEILTLHPEMDFVQLQINYEDWESPLIQSRECYEVARKHGKPIIVMEPVKGGALATIPENVEKIFRDEEPEMSAASWAMRFAADLDGVVMVLSGMSSVEQMKENISYMKDFTKLNDKQKETIQKVKKELDKLPCIPCTTCKYCEKVCPENIGISGSFTAMNFLIKYNNITQAKDRNHWLVKMRNKNWASQCIKCGKCEEACPQHIKIRDELDRVTKEILS